MSVDPDAAERELAEQALRQLIAKLGLSFHPERPIDEYVQTSNGASHDAQLLEAMAGRGMDVPEAGTPTFSDEDARYYQACLDIAWHVYGEGIYDVIKTIEPWKTYFEDLEANEEPDQQEEGT